jgi:hypothetical protein
MDMDENGIVTAYKTQKILSYLPNEWLTNIAKVGKKFFLLGSGGNLYFKSVADSEERYLSTAFFEMPVILQAKINGKEGFLVKGEGAKTYFIVDEGVEEYTLPIGKPTCEYNERLYIANANELYFSKQNDYTDFTMDYDKGGVVKTDLKDGSILKLVQNDGKLIVFTQKAIYEFIANGERIDYMITRKANFNFDGLFVDSVKSCLNQVVFVCDSKLYEYSDGEVKKASSLLDYEGCVVQDSFGIDGGVYYVAVAHRNIGNCVLRYDFGNKKQCLIECAYPLVCDEGIVTDNAGNLFSIVETEALDRTCSFSSVDFDFGNAKDKVIHKISLFSSEDGKMTIQSDCGSSVFTLKKGANEKRTNLPSSTYSLSFSSNRAICPTKIKIEYRIKEK